MSEEYTSNFMCRIEHHSLNIELSSSYKICRVFVANRAGIGVRRLCKFFLEKSRDPPILLLPLGCVRVAGVFADAVFAY